MTMLVPRAWASARPRNTTTPRNAPESSTIPGKGCRNRFVENDVGRTQQADQEDQPGRCDKAQQGQFSQQSHPEIRKMIAFDRSGEGGKRGAGRSRAGAERVDQRLARM
jgi:hypothetical protein